MFGCGLQLNGSFAGTASSASWTSNGTGSLMMLIFKAHTPSAGDLAMILLRLR